MVKKKPISTWFLNREVVCIRFVFVYSDPDFQSWLYPLDHMWLFKVTSQFFSSISSSTKLLPGNTVLMSTWVLTDEAFRIVLGSINDNHYSVSQSNTGFFFFFWALFKYSKIELVGEWSILQLSFFVIILWETWEECKEQTSW